MEARQQDFCGSLKEKRREEKRREEKRREEKRWGLQRIGLERRKVGVAVFIEGI